MAGELATAFVRVRPNLTGFQKEAEAGVKKSMSGIQKAALGALSITAGVGVAHLIESTIEAATGRQSALAQIQQTVKNAGAQWEVYGKTVEEVLDEQENRSGFDFEELAQGLGRLTQQTKSSQKGLQLLGTAENIARARHMELAQVTVALSRAYAGNTQSLSRLGIIIPKYTQAAGALKTQHDNLVASGVKLSKQQQLEYKNALAAAQAQDKQKGSAQALAEVERRYAGQSDAYAKSAAGSFARFHVAVQQLQETVGNQLLPQLTDAANAGSQFALKLAGSEQVAASFRGVANGIASGAEAVGTAFRIASPFIEEAVHLLDAIGVGPILTAVAAYKALGFAVNLYGVAQAKVAAIEKARTVALAASLGGNAEMVAQYARLKTFEEGLADGRSAQTAALIANNGQLVTNTELTTLNTAAAIRSGEIGALMAEGYNAQTAALIANNGQLVTNIELQNARALAAARSGGAGLLGAVGLTPVTAAILGVAALAGGIYYLSTVESEASKQAKDFAKNVTALQDAAKGVTDGITATKQAALDKDRAEIARNAAAMAVTAARDRVRADTSASTSVGKLATDQRKLRDATLDLRQANLDYTRSQDAATEARKKFHADQAAQATAQAKIIAQAQDAANVILPKMTGPGDDARIEAAAYRVKQFNDRLDNLISKSKDASPALRAAVQNLKDVATETGKIPDDKTIAISLNLAAFKRQYAEVQAILQNATDFGSTKLGKSISDLTGGIDDQLNRIRKPAKPLLPNFSKAMGIDPPAVAKTISATIETGLADGSRKAGPTIAQQVATALKQAVLDAKQSLSSIGDTLGGQIGQVMDASLKASEAKLASSPAAARIKSLLAEVNREQAARNARAAGAAVDTTAADLAKLQKAFGPGAHTADQDAQLVAAQNAVLDAQSNQREQAAQREADRLQKGLDLTKANLEKHNEAEKTAAARRLADLNSELDRGLISQKTYVSRLNDLLRKEGVNFKSAGKYLGEAFAQGFQEQLNAAISQAKIIAALPAAQRGQGSGNAPIVVDPRKVAATTQKTLTDQADAKALTKNTSETVAEIKKLGAIMDKHGSRVTFTIPPGTSKKDAAEIVKLAKSLNP